MKIKNILRLSLALFCTACSLTSLFSCGQDRWPEYYPRTGSDLWIDSIMREEYLWYETIPAFEELNYFQVPATFLKSLLASDDKNFSVVDSLSPVISPTYGFEYTLNKLISSDTIYYALITNVLPQSPASEAGLQRGEWITAIDNFYITKKNEKELLGGTDALDIEVGNYLAWKESVDEDNEKDTVAIVQRRNASLPAARLVTEETIPVHTIIANKVGYMLYNSFDEAADEQLRELSQYYKEEGIADFVLDLRFNSGGSMESAQLLGTILAPADKLNSPFVYRLHSDKQNSKDDCLTLDTQLLQSGSNLNLSHLYVLTSNTTAGTAEMLINCLRPYMTVTLIGEKTKGENLGLGKFISNEHGLILRPVICEVFNAEGTADYANGFTPDKAVAPLKDYYKILPFGNPEEALLSQALQLINESN